ncbi:unnamed protein product [Adineta ricciae]|uniref:F-box domain-containing protein n=1 Tax=Adineta ricciae TaxID=249248 RepID=A0A814YX26_ADIRI|nr:unnamed protein product [Adineta ricciae]
MIAGITKSNIKSENSSINLLRLEVLPDEIFQCVDPIDLRNFKGLNKRIDCLIDSVKMNIVIQRQEDCDLDYISNFASTQIIRLEICDYCLSLSFRETIELRSLTFNCSYLLEEQLSQITKVNLPRLERLSIDDIPYSLQEPVFDVIFQSEQFVVLVCQMIII